MPPNPLARPFAPPLASAATGTSPQTAATIASSSTPNISTTLPSLPILADFLQSHLPELSPLGSASEVSWLYHSPLPPRRKPNQALPAARQCRDIQRPLPSNSCVQKLVLSITPTKGVYTALGAAPLPPPLDQTSSGAGAVPEPITHSAPAQSIRPAPPRATRNDKFTTAAFIHRPWTLTRGRLPHGTTVWSSHKAFDESLTVGCNIALMARLGTDVQGESTKVLVGYKGDEGRRIGIVAGFGEKGVQMEDVRERVKREFGDLEREGGGWFGFDRETKTYPENGKLDHGIDGSGQPPSITAIACMNAFHPAEVDRVATAAVEASFASSLDDCSGVLYLTGAIKEEGLQAALQKKMKVVCVGHRICEVWGVSYLAERVRQKWPGMRVEVVDEEEVKPEPKEKKGLKSATWGKKDGVSAVGPKEQSEGTVVDFREANSTRLAKKRRKGDVDEDDGGRGHIL